MLSDVNYRLTMGRYIEVDELWDAEEVATALGLSSRNAVSVYRKRYPDFPEPIVTKGSCLLWDRTEVLGWHSVRTRG